MARVPFSCIHMFFVNKVRISLPFLLHSSHLSCKHGFFIQLYKLNYNNIFCSLNLEVNSLRVCTKFKSCKPVTTTLFT